ncbi:hypothetical protein PtA15_13A312 [Puccinia triticina]|uniref:Uncharacterized protein n=1 Tax=Puccinia triticina TaxID=208348 RepID=A0ABY7D7L3_9BASI|nr:uncharacterized protein PtA15_13A312 [Puccinia triticina]WAQ90912.1 hypothetical protein PtA15_13A312 [Puccinia triticina]
MSSNSLMWAIYYYCPRILIPPRLRRRRTLLRLFEAILLALNEHRNFVEFEGVRYNVYRPEQEAEINEEDEADEVDETDDEGEDRRGQLASNTTSRKRSMVLNRLHLLHSKPASPPPIPP